MKPTLGYSRGTNMWAIRRRERYKTEGRCVICGTALQPAQVTQKCGDCSLRVSEANKRYRIKNRHKLEALRTQVLEHYGSSCAWCGESDPMFLTIDHIAGDGKEQRKQHHSGVYFYRYIIDSGFPIDLQVLCWNCNCAKAYRGLTKDYFDSLWNSQIDLDSE